MANLQKNQDLLGSLDGLPRDAAPSNTSSEPNQSQEPNQSNAVNTPAPQPKIKRPHDPARANKLLKANRKGIGGPKTAAGKARSSRNHLKHGCYSKMPFRILASENQEDLDREDADLRANYQPVDATTARVLDLFIHASFRLNRVNAVEFEALNNRDCVDLDKYLRGLNSVEHLRATCERSYYRHLKELRKLLGEVHQVENAAAQAAAVEKAKRYNDLGEEMHPDFPQPVIRKLSCDPDDPCNELSVFDCTLAGHHSVERTPLRNYKNGYLLAPQYKPKQVKGPWPEHLLGPWAKDPNFVYIPPKEK